MTGSFPAVERALRVLGKKMQREGVFREMKQRRSYEKPSEKKTRAKSEAIRRARKLARKQAIRVGLLPAPPKQKPLERRPPLPEIKARAEARSAECRMSRYGLKSMPSQHDARRRAFELRRAIFAGRACFDAVLQARELGFPLGLDLRAALERGACRNPGGRPLASVFARQPDEIVEQRRDQRAVSRILGGQAGGIEVEQMARLHCGLRPGRRGHGHHAVFEIGLALAQIPDLGLDLAQGAAQVGGFLRGHAAVLVEIDRLLSHWPMLASAAGTVIIVAIRR